MAAPLRHTGGIPHLVMLELQCLGGVIDGVSEHAGRVDARLANEPPDDPVELRPLVVQPCGPGARDPRQGHAAPLPRAQGAEVLCQLRGLGVVGWGGEDEGA